MKYIQIISILTFAYLILDKSRLLLIHSQMQMKFFRHRQVSLLPIEIFRNTHKLEKNVK